MRMMIVNFSINNRNWETRRAGIRSDYDLIDCGYDSKLVIYFIFD